MPITLNKNQERFSKATLSQNTKIELEYCLKTTLEGFGSYDMRYWALSKEEWTDAIKAELNTRV